MNRSSGGTIPPGDGHNQYAETSCAGPASKSRGLDYPPLPTPLVQAPRPPPCRSRTDAHQPPGLANRLSENLVVRRSVLSGSSVWLSDGGGLTLNFACRPFWV